MFDSINIEAFVINYICREFSLLIVFANIFYQREHIVYQHALAEK